jgi:dolichyl-phosphate-mannose-protein mannosyltransferase
MKACQTVVHANLAAAASRGLLHPGALLLVTVLLGLFLRCFHVENHELQYDEGATGYFSALPWSDLWGSPAVLEPNPPLFYTLARIVTHAGGSVEQIRYVSAIAGILCIPLAWLIARHLAGNFAAAGAAMLVATSPQHIAISQYARSYAFLILLLTCAFYCLLQARHSVLARPPKGRLRRLWWWSGYAISGAAALYTHHTAIIVLVALNLSILLVAVRNDDGGRRFLREWLVANLFVAGLYAPWLPVLYSQIHPLAATSSTTIVHVPPLQRLWNTISNPFRFAGLPWIDVRLLPIILFGAWQFRLSRDVAFLLAFVVAGLVLMVLVSQYHPLLDGKTLGWAGLFSVVATAVGCSAFGRFRLPLLIVVILLELPAGWTALHPAPEGWREVAAILRENARPQDTLYVNYAAAVLPLRHYGWSDSGMNVKVFAKTNEESWFRGHAWPIIAPQSIAGEAAHVNRVWLMTYGSPPPDGIANEIATTSVSVLHRRTEKLDLSLFLPMTAASSPASQ